MHDKEFKVAAIGIKCCVFRVLALHYDVVAYIFTIEFGEDDGASKSVKHFISTKDDIMVGLGNDV